MFIAMNRFKVTPGKEAEFEAVWKERETFLDTVPGFKTFSLLRGPQSDEFSLYASHSEWQDKASFEAWTKSEQFRKAHAGAGQTKGLYAGHPVFEGFEVIINS